MENFKFDYTNIFIIGCKRRGKSTLLNSLGFNFEAGRTFNNHITKEHTKKSKYLNNLGYITVHDLPGLDYPSQDIIAKNNTILQNAVTDIKNFRVWLIFIVSLQNGVPQTEDISAIKLVLSQLQRNVYYSIIINQCTEQDLKDRDMIENNLKTNLTDKYIKKKLSFGTY